MSTLVSQPVPQASWKEEVNRRLEEHKSRRGLAIAPKSSSANAHPVSDRAANAAARVAARFAKVPSYSEMQASEARAALRAAEAATRAALEAQAAAQAALAHFEAETEDFEFKSASVHRPGSDAEEISSESDISSESSVAVHIDEPSSHSSADSFAIRWDAELPVQHTDLAASHAHLGTSDPFADSTLIAPEPPVFSEPDYEVVEAALPIPANLIHFPREIVATRRMRPRISGVPQNVAEEQYGQLSIFEVDPNSISTEPVAMVADVSSAAGAIAGPEWSGIRLDAEPEPIVERRAAPAPAASNIHLAPLELRLMATAIDATLTVALFCAGMFSIARHLQHHIPLHTAEVSGVLCFFVLAVLYQVFFLLSTHTTPGMMYAGISLCTFEDETPTRMQLRDRLIALVISVVPMGLGMAWAIFDDDHLSWHDRFSRTYKRKN